MYIPGNNFEEEQFATREERDKRWEELMLVKPHVHKTTSWIMEGDKARTVWLVLYPRLVEGVRPLGMNEEMGRTDAGMEAFEKAGEVEALSE